MDEVVAREGGAREGVPGDVLALASSLDSRVYHRLGEIVCEPHAHCVSEYHTCARAGQDTDEHTP